MTYKEPYIIAEIGCNHKGDLQIAKELIYMAKIFGNANAVKFKNATIGNCLQRSSIMSHTPIRQIPLAIPMGNIASFWNLM